MQPRMSASDLQDTQALAHALYCQCQELAGPYQTASQNLKALHDTLEEIVEVFDDDFAAQKEIILFDQAAGECKRLLNAIDRTLDQDRQPLANNANNVKWTARIEVVTRKLLNAWEALEPKIGSKAFYHTSTRPSTNAPKSQPASITRSELDGAASTMSSLQSFGSTQRSGIAGPSFDMLTSGQEGREIAVNQHTEQSMSGTDPTTLLSPIAFESWKSPFAFADPMSSDIDTASYLILADNTSIPSSTVATETGSKRATNEIPSAKSARGSHVVTASIQLQNAGNAATLSSRGPRPAASAAPKNFAVHKTELAPTRLGPTSLQESIFSNKPGGLKSRRSYTTALYSKSADSVALHGEAGPQKPRYRVVNADPSQSEEESDEANLAEGLPTAQHESGAPEPPGKTLRLTLGRGSLLTADKRKARVFDADDDDDGGVDLHCEKLTSLHDESHSTSLDPNAVEDLPLHASESEVQAQEEAASAVVQAWNEGRMDQAELHLQEILVLPPISPESSRRAHHLLGVMASLKGKWDEALTLFLSVLTFPSTDAKQLDAGDCAAAYWMGDIYALSKRRTEALVAYTIVEQGLASLDQDATTSPQQLLQRVRTEQRISQAGNDKEYFERQLDNTPHDDDNGTVSQSSILNPSILSREAAQMLLDSLQWPPDNAISAVSHQSRAMALCDLDPKSSTWQDLHRLQLHPSALAPSATWPMQFDPLFASANIACGLPLSARRDLLQLKDIPRTSGALGRSRMNCFTCQDLRWLVTTLRACMKRLELKYSEIANNTGTWLIPQYSSTEGTIASTHFISIAIFRLTFRSGYGVEICPGGIFSSRVLTVEEKGGGHAHELKRIKKLIRSYMDAALRRKEALEEKDLVVPVMSINGVTSIQRGSMSKAKGKRPESVSSSSPATSSRSGSLFN